MEATTSTQFDSSQTRGLDIKGPKSLDADQWLIDDNFDTLLKVSDAEMQSHRLDIFNEKFNQLIQKQMSQNCTNAADKIKRRESCVVTDPNYIAPHIKVGPGVIRPTVLALGDPFRCEILAKMCDKQEEVQWNREYRLYNVSFEGADFSVISHGIGGPGAAICFEELAKLGAKTIIRLGTCGAMQSHIKTGDLIVASGACREDGYTDFVAPKGFPAVGDNELTLALYNQAQALNANVHIGACLTSGLFYEGPSVPSTMKLNAECGALFVEMEVAALFIIGTMRGIRTAALATADGNVFEHGNYDPHGTIVAEGKKKMLMIGLCVAKKACEEDAQSGEITVFEQQAQMKYLDLFRSSSLYDYIQNKTQLSDKHKAGIYKLALKGSFANFKFFLEKGTTLTEQEIMDSIILFTKVQNNADQGFAKKVDQFIKQENKEAY